MVLASSLFVLLAVPILYTVLVTVFFEKELGRKRFNRAFFSGMLLFVLVQVIYQFIKLFYKINYEWFPLYIFLWATEILPFIIVLVSGYFLLVRRGVFRQDSYLEYPHVFSYTAGLLVLAGLFRSVNSLWKLDSYILFLYPLLIISILILFPVIVVEAGVRRGYGKALFFALLLPYSLILVLIPWLFYINYFFISLGTALFISAGSLAAFLLLRKDYIRK